MTGAYLMAQRDGVRKPVEVEHLTPVERREKLAGREMEEVMRWMDLLSETVVENEKLLTELEAAGLITKGVRLSGKAER